MFYACSVWKRVLVSSGTAMLAGPASNFASHGGPFNEERLDNGVPTNVVDLLNEAWQRFFGGTGQNGMET